MSLNQRARYIISHNEYLTLATIDEGGKPWTCILAYSFDADYSFYFVSLPTANHSKHLVQNPTISFTVFDSHQDFGKGVGVQGVGVIAEAPKDETEKIATIYFSRSYPYGNIHNEFMDGLKKLLHDGTYRFYKLTPTHVWINDPDADTDRRVEVDLKTGE